MSKITRQDVLTALNEPTIKQRADRIMELIGGDEWISVDVGLPDYGVKVLAARNNHVLLTVHQIFEINRSWYHVDDNGIWSAAVMYQPTHWMPLPEPPKETQNN